MWRFGIIQIDMTTTIYTIKLYNIKKIFIHLQLYQWYVEEKCDSLVHVTIVYSHHKTASFETQRDKQGRVIASIKDCAARLALLWGVWRCLVVWTCRGCAFFVPFDRVKPQINETKSWKYLRGKMGYNTIWILHRGWQMGAIQSIRRWRNWWRFLPTELLAIGVQVAYPDSVVISYYEAVEEVEE